MSSFAFDLTRHSVTGLSDVLKNYRKFRRLFHQLLTLARSREPHAIICVDFSGFNRRFAAAVKRQIRARRGRFRNWDPKIIQYVSPQVWPSREDRARQIARDFDQLLSIFPFERDWYAARVPKLRVEFVGHPIVDRYAPMNVANHDVTFSILHPPSAPSLLLLPGSRSDELNRHLPVMFEALKLIQAAIPEIRPSLVVPTESLLSQVKSRPLPSALEIRRGGLAESLKTADLAIASTGTVTLECAWFRVPTVAIYQTSWSTYQIGRRIIKVKYLAMPNLLAGEEIMPEFIQNAATAENISRAALQLLRDRSRRQAVQNKLAEVIASLGGSGASARAAAAILKTLPSG